MHFMFCPLLIVLMLPHHYVLVKNFIKEIEMILHIGAKAYEKRRIDRKIFSIILPGMLPYLHGVQFNRLIEACPGKVWLD